MPTCPHHHPLAASRPSLPVDRTIPPRPAGAEDPDEPDRPDDPRSTTGGRGPTTPPRGRLAAQDGSVATEYGLLAVVAATIVSVLLEWATSGGITALLSSILARVSDLVGL